jgi:PST family polysaccharide transporter
VSDESTSGAADPALKGARSAGALRLFQLLAGVLSIALMARLLGPEAYGVYGLAMVVVGFGQIAGSVWGGGYVAMHDARDADFDALAWISIGVAALGTVVLLAMSGPLGNIRGFEQAASLLPALSLLLLLGAPVVFLSAEAQRQGRYDLLAQSETASAAVAVVSGIVCAFLGFGVWSFVGMEFARSVVRLGILALRAGVWPRLRCRAEDFKRAAAFDGTRLSGRLLQWADLAVPRLVIARFLGEEALGLFVLGWRVYSQLKEVVVGPFAMFAMPAIAALRGDRAAIHGLLDTWQRLSAFLAFPVIIGFVLVCPLLVDIWLGEGWPDAAIVMQLLALAGLRSASSAFNGAVLDGMGRPGLQLLTYAAGLAASLVLVPIGLAVAGVAGVAAATLLRSFLTWPVSTFLVARVSGYPPGRQFTTVFPAALSACIMGAVVMLVQFILPPDQSDWTVLAACIATGFVTYGLASGLVQRGNFIQFIALLRGHRPSGAASPS